MLRTNIVLKRSFGKYVHVKIRMIVRDCDKVRSVPQTTLSWCAFIGLLERF